MPKVFLVTGSSRGLGRQIADAVLAGGHQLLATARDPSQVGDLVDQHPDRARAFALDVTDESAADAAVKAVLEAFGRLDVVVNNAGYADFASFEDTAPESFRSQVETNLFGVINVTRAALPVLRKQGSGHIIQISSVGGRVASVGLSAYQAAKWAVGGFSQVLAQEVAPFGVKVSVLEPGGMSTDWAGSSMSIPPVSPPYEATIGRQVAGLVSGDRTAGGDVLKVARVVVEIAELDDPPVRLLLGPDAVNVAGAFERARAESDAKWRDLSMSTVNDGASPESLNPLSRIGLSDS